MKWRCTWCGKPHAENDPPCDECGHNSFEEAVVRADETDTETVDTGPTYVWTCRECGRDHVRNTPPCSRCGAPHLERTEQRYDDLERDLEVPGWLAVAKPYLPVVAVVGVVAVLFATGILSPSMLPGIGAPSPPDAPGDGTEAAGIDLEETELAVHERLADERGGGGTAYDEDLAAFAEYNNRAAVAREHDGGDHDVEGPDEFGVDCGSEFAWQPFALGGPSIDEYDESALADAVADAVLGSSVGDAAREGRATEGLDVHAGETGTVYVTYATC